MNVDTLSIARDLRAAELPPEQAEAIAAAIGRSVSEGSATKADLEVVRAAIETKIEQLRTTLMIWSVGTTLTMAAIVIGAVKL